MLLRMALNFVFILIGDAAFRQRPFFFARAGMMLDFRQMEWARKAPENPARGLAGGTREPSVDE